MHCVRNEGFSEKLVTTSFFDENIDDIFAKLHPEDKGDAVSNHNVFGMLGLMFADRTAAGAPVSLTSFRPFVAGACGDWRAHGGVTRSVNLMAGELAKQIQVVSSGDSFSFSLTPAEDVEHRVNSVVKSVTQQAPSANAHSDENVFEICAEIDGHRQNATVALYHTSDGTRVVDGKNILHSPCSLPCMMCRDVLCYDMLYCLYCAVIHLMCYPVYSVCSAVWIDGQTGDNSTHSQFQVPAVSYSSGASVSSRPCPAR